MPSSARTRWTPTRWLAIALLALSACGPAPAPPGLQIPPKVMERPVYVIEIGDGAKGLAERTVRLCADLNVIAIPLKPFPLDPRLANPQRRAVAAEDLVEEVKRSQAVMVGSAGTIIVAVTAADMYVRERPEWPFANAWSAEERFAVISVAHLDPARTGSPPDPTRFESRFRKVLYRTLGSIFFRLPSPKDSRGLMRPTPPDLDALDALPPGFTVEDLNPAPEGATGP